MATHEFGMTHVRSSSVSLLAEATSGTGSSGNTLEDKLGKIEIYKNLTEYEDVLAKLIESVDKFHPNLKYAQELIQADYDMYFSLATFAKYDDIDSRLSTLEDKRMDIDQQTRDILETLNECHDNLNNLPSLDQVEFERDTILAQRKKVNSTTLLDYATKLSKFTKIPPTFDKGSIGPNNFVWPGDDALRRGMLALASLNSGKLTAIKGQTKENEPAITAKTTDDNTTDIVNEMNPEKQEVDADNISNDRRGSFVFGANHENESHTEEKKENSDNEDIDLDLDLFNPDEF
ncbi:similar to Saccharomyces cerevisiae YOR174W MED4 Subunit of the RNA polymerase II mediator complex [Maudiozyma barnettii]|uniref:Mediator of RNA polymerase II transcription subunit 4 n=1 Tax=Maudiozyma barnettii TaxID=61262 RepID=A0A8H2VHX0_9SACH|nr:Med4p [Kazachstania barnettii]CAB4255539.1 similar to Saccharomyces cerevisiae YOR174W MED4 Subunit of the RNA polymerase II mediator complex [Kazachstania barnettii]CAD1784038.1 similar to Saccharomyces cerevisiae YOR174W MED4 Subunit of the RNA polymerase II mediator complex [Kazachstania barnettii]